MVFNLYKLKHFFFNKYILSNFNRKRYYISYDYKHKAIWYRTYKVASRTIDSILREDCKFGQYIYASYNPYLPILHKKYFKFAFVRNPESRFISAWKDKVLKQNYFNFSETVYEEMKELNNFISWVSTQDMSNCDEHLKKQKDLIDIDNVDFVGRFENLEKDLTYVLKKLKISDKKIPQLNKGIDYISKISPTQRERIADIYREDFEIFYPELLYT